MRQALLHIVAAIALTASAVPGQAAEIALLTAQPSLALGRVTPASGLALVNIYGSIGSALTGGWSTESLMSEIKPLSSEWFAAGTTAAPPGTLRGGYDLAEPARLNSASFVALDLANVDLSDPHLSYSLGNWPSYRGVAPLIGIMQQPLILQPLDTGIGWKSDVGLTPSATSGIGIPLTSTYRGVRFGANYHF